MYIFQSRPWIFAVGYLCVCVFFLKISSQILQSWDENSNLCTMYFTDSGHIFAV